MGVSENKLSDEELEGFLQELGVNPHTIPMNEKETQSIETIEQLLRQASHRGGSFLPKPLKLKSFFILTLSLAIFISLVIGVGLGWMWGRSAALKQAAAYEQILPLLSDIQQTIQTLSHSPSSPSFPEEEIIEPLPEPDEMEKLAPEEIR